jgi:hypothetical protein
MAQIMIYGERPQVVESGGSLAELAGRTPAGECVVISSDVYSASGAALRRFFRMARTPECLTREEVRRMAGPWFEVELETTLRRDEDPLVPSKSRETVLFLCRRKHKGSEFDCSSY